MDKKDYKLTVSFNISAYDDIEARLIAREILEEQTGILGIEHKAVKLQQIFKDREPQKVEI